MRLAAVARIKAYDERLFGCSPTIGLALELLPVRLFHGGSGSALGASRSSTTGGRLTPRGALVAELERPDALVHAGSGTVRVRW